MRSFVRSTVVAKTYSLNCSSTHHRLLQHCFYVSLDILEWAFISNYNKSYSNLILRITGNWFAAESVVSIRCDTVPCKLRCRWYHECKETYRHQGLALKPAVSCRAVKRVQYEKQRSHGKWKTHLHNIKKDFQDITHTSVIANKAHLRPKWKSITGETHIIRTAHWKVHQNYITFAF